MSVLNHGPWSNLIPFLCGSSKVCRKRNEEALQIAKKNVREKYLVIGIAEDLPNTVKAFKKLIPSVFFAKSNNLWKFAKFLSNRHFWQKNRLFIPFEN